jgi:nucleotide-binding universal stress UspA family protein
MSILVATDLSPASQAAVRMSARLADACEEDLTIAHFLDVPPSASWAVDAEMREALVEEAREKTESELATFVQQTFAATDAPEMTVDVRVETVAPDPGIVDLADEQEASLIVVGATGRGALAETLLGSTAEDVVRRADRPVLVVPPDQPPEPFEHVVAPVDLTDCSRRSLRTAMSFAQADEASLEVIYGCMPPGANVSVFQPMSAPYDRQDLLAEHQRRFDSFVDEFDLEDLEAYTRFQSGGPIEVIMETVDDVEADLIVMGTHGRRGLERLFLGSTATKILRRMPCAVMVVPPTGYEIDPEDDQ